VRRSLDPKGGERRGGVCLDPAEGESPRLQHQDLVIEVAGGELERLPDIVILQLGVFLPKLRPIRVQGNGFHDAAHGQAHTADARPPVHDFGIDSDAIKGLVHRLSEPQIVRFQFQISAPPQAGRALRGSAELEGAVRNIFVEVAETLEISEQTEV